MSDKRQKNSGEKNVGVMKRLWKYAKKYRLAFVISLIAATLYVGFSLILPILFGKATDLIIGKDNVDVSGLMKIFAVAAVAAILAGASQWVTETLCNRISNGITARIRRDVFVKLENLPLKYLDGRSSGDLSERGNRRR